ncbi:MAG: TonB-dependent receptor [Cryomorphaceae bacterium]|nr:TonB-dependent receptor [Cryomorphaceae bacterium]
MRQLLLGTWLFISTCTIFAQTNTVGGFVVDAEIKQPLQGIRVIFYPDQDTIYTNNKGGFEYKTSRDSVYFVVENSDYFPLVQAVDFKKASTSQPSGGKGEVIYYEQLTLKPKVSWLSAVDVKALTGSSRTPIATTTLDKQRIVEFNEGRDIPFILEQTPSVVSTSDAGAGIGYTGMRIRGSDQTRINVTINGIPVNDAESQGVFWVNMPDLASSLNSIQIQRGLGTSTNGPGAFGASVHLETEGLRTEAYGEADLFAGSFNTQRSNIRFGTGNQKGWSLDGRLSRISSDGYLDRASSDLSSYYLSGGYTGKETSIRFITFGGRERTYQAWYGVSPDMLFTNPTYNPAGEIRGTNAAGDRTVLGFYDDQVDNYRQDHYQLHLNHRFNKNLKLHTALHYTFGEGYYEEYRNAHGLSNYNLPPIVVNDSTTVTNSDLTRRLWLRNHFGGIVYSLQYETSKTLITAGGAASYYTGDHFGEVLWVNESPDIRDVEFYNNVGNKIDANQYLKIEKQIGEVTAFADAQVRYVHYTAEGVDRNLSDIDVDDALLFFNPKIGFSLPISESQSVYLSAGYGGREPARRDYLEAIDEMPRPEFMFDVEAGTKFSFKNLTFETNLYFMDYYDQLVLTGELSDVGFALRKNVGRSFRAGVEFNAALQISKKWSLLFNAAFSENRNMGWNEVVAFDSITNAPITEDLGNTAIAFSPNVILGSTLRYSPIKPLMFGWTQRYVGKQYVSNTQEDDLSLPAYFVNDLRISWNFKTKALKFLEASLFVNNIFGNNVFRDFFGERSLIAQPYASNGYSYSYAWGNQNIREMGLYPQAGTNFMFGVRMGF